MPYKKFTKKADSNIMSCEEDFYEAIYKRLGALKKELVGLQYKGVFFYGIVKIPIYNLFKNQYFFKGNKFPLIKDTVWFIRNILQSIFCPLIYKKKKKNTLWPAGAILSVFDHGNIAFIEMQADIFSKINKEACLALTTSKDISAKFREANINCIDIAVFEKSSSITLLHFHLLLKFIRKASIVKKHGIALTLACSYFLLKGFKLIEFYDTSFNEIPPKAVLTLNDVQSHEYVITLIAKKKKIPTFTLQHGLVDELHTPVASDRIFIWGENVKRELIKYRIDSSKIVVSGKPAFDKQIKKTLDERVALKQSFINKNPKAKGKRIVTYIAGNFGPVEEKKLLECVLSIADEKIFLLIKLKPTISEKQFYEFSRQIQNFCQHNRFCIYFKEDLYRLLAITDILVGFQTTVVVEAFVFSIVCIVLDIFDHINLKEILPHYDDCIIARNSTELNIIVSRLVKEKNALQDQKSYFKKIGDKYFFFPQGTDSSQLIYNYIVNYKRERNLLD